MIIIQFNLDDVVEALEDRAQEYWEVIQTGFARAGQLMVARFQDQQLSGRHGDDTGLNIQSGNLRASLRSLTEIEGHEIRSMVENAGATYWQYHQTGTEKLPKRLFLKEDFAGEGSKLYTSEIELAFGRMAA